MIVHRELRGLLLLTVVELGVSAGTVVVAGGSLSALVALPYAALAIRTAAGLSARWRELRGRMPAIAIPPTSHPYRSAQRWN